MSDRKDSGFSLVEALIAMALMGVVLVFLSAVTDQWLPNWRRGFATVQNDELLGRALDRLTADLSAARAVPLGGRSAGPFFVGSTSSLIFVRGPLGPDAGPGLEFVRLSEETDASGSKLVRTHARFAPVLNADSLPRLGDPVTVFSGRYRVQFSYSGQDRVWKPNWANVVELPRSIRILVTDRSGKLLPASTVALLHVDGPSTNCPQSSCRPGASRPRDGDPALQTSQAGP